MTPRKKPKFVFLLTPEEEQAIIQHAQGVWNDVGYDCLKAVADERGKDIEQVSMARRDVVEIVMDADRLYTAIKTDHRAMALPGIQTLMKAWGWNNTDMDEWQSASQTVRTLLQKKAFQATHYGL